MTTLKVILEKIYGHLGAARTQRLPTDDAIIAEHIDAAHALASAALALINEDVPEPKIITTHVYPPIPLRQFDYSAVRDGYEPGAPMGYGKTAFDAERDLIEEEELRK